MMDRREALLLIERLKRRTRDPDVLMLCEYVHGTDVHGTIPGFRRPGDGTPPAVIPSSSCPVCAARRAAETARKKDGAMGAETDVSQGRLVAARQPCPGAAAEVPGIRDTLKLGATGRLHVRRVKSGSPSVHPMQGDEIRALRRARWADDAESLPSAIRSDRGSRHAPPPSPPHTNR